MDPAGVPADAGLTVRRKDLVEHRAQLRRFLDSARAAPAKLRNEEGLRLLEENVVLPSAKQIALAALAGYSSRRAEEILDARVAKGMHLLKPSILYLIAKELDQPTTAGFQRFLERLATGLGILIPSKPISSGKRRKELDRAHLDSMDDDTLTNEVLKMIEPEEAEDA